MGLGLHQRVEFELHLASQHQPLRVVGAAAQQQLGQLAGPWVVALLFGQQGIQEHRLRVLGGGFLHQRKLLGGGRNIALGQVHRDQRVVRGHQVGLDRQGLLVGGHHGGLVVGMQALQHLGLEHPAIAELGLALEQRLHLLQGARGVTLGQAQAGAQHQGRCQLGLALQGLGLQGAGGGQVVVHGLGDRQLGLEFGVGQRFAQIGLAVLLRQLAALLLGHHGLGQQRQHGGLGLGQFQRALQLGLGRGRLATGQQQFAQQQAPGA